MSKYTDTSKHTQGKRKARNTVSESGSVVGVDWEAVRRLPESMLQTLDDEVMLDVNEVLRGADARPANEAKCRRDAKPANEAPHGIRWQQPQGVTTPVHEPNEQANEQADSTHDPVDA